MAPTYSDKLTANPANPRATDGCMYSRGIAAATLSPAIAWLFSRNSRNRGSGSTGAVACVIAIASVLEAKLAGEVIREVVDGLVLEQDRG